MSNTNLKEYYININKLYNNAVNILTAINQSFHSSTSEVNVMYTDSDDMTQMIRIPSFLYLENRIEQLDSNFASLFNMPKSGEAWFHNNEDMYKLEFVKSTSAPITPVVNNENIFAYVKDTNIFKDLVNPKTYLKIDISNLPNNIEKMLVKKIVFFNANTFNSIRQSNSTSYNEYKALLYNLNKGIDYDEYDSVIDLPIKEDDYISNFYILNVDDSYESNESSVNRRYKITVDTITYTKEDDSSIEYTLQTGQYICLDNEYVVFQIIDMNITQLSNELIIEEVIGHMTLQTYEENQNMILHLYNQNYDKFHYIELPLEENQYVAFFLSTLYNNVKSTFSEPILLNLDEISMIDENGNKLMNNGKEVSYIEYYNKYCQNIGDMILGFSKVSYSQISNYTINELSELQNGDVIQKFVSDTISLDNLTGQRINTHLIDDEYTSKVINLHSKRNELSNNIDNIQANIDNIYNQLVNTNFENEELSSQLTLKSKLDQLYNEKTIVQKQLISVIDNINVLKTNVYGTSAAKYRIRGNTLVSTIENYLKETYYRCNIIQMEVQYKYKSIGSDTTNVQNINSNLFTDWNKLETIERERKIIFDDDSNSYHIEYENYNELTNIIKWNQVEIPINQGEDVIIRVRYKYSIGQPFINLYTPWSDEVTIIFPQEFTDNLELTTIMAQNDDDAINARFMSTLFNDGYSEHVNNKIVDNSQIYFHMPENIYSGFNTPENSLISLKDKLQSMCNDIDTYKEVIQSDIESSYSVYLSLDNNNIQLFPNKNNTFVVNESEGIETFTTKNLQLIIKNTGIVPLRLYSIFPGNSDKLLIQFDNNTAKSLNSTVYENVPILVEGESYIGQTAFETAKYQTLGQFIYFRENSIFNTDFYYINKYNGAVQMGNILYNEFKNKNEDNTDKVIDKLKNSEFILNTFKDVINTNYQMGLPVRYRQEDINISQNQFGVALLEFTQNATTRKFGNFTPKYIDNSLVTENFGVWANNILNRFNFAEYLTNKNDSENVNKLNNKFVLRYEHIYGKYKESNNTPDTSDDKLLQLTNNYSLLSTIGKSEDGNRKTDDLYEFYYMNSSSERSIIKLEDLVGAFFIPTLISHNDILCTEDNNSKITINVGESISVPLLFQYYLQNSNSSITKTLSFDLKKSQFKGPENFTISITAKFNSSKFVDQYSNSQSYIIDSIE